MNPVKEYKNASFRELMAYAAHNSQRTRALLPIHHASTLSGSAAAAAAAAPTLQELYLPTYTSCPLNPTGPLSVFACILDPEYYQLVSQPIRSELVSQLTTEWQGRIDELKHTSLARKKKKIYESIGAAFQQQPMESKDYLDLYAGLCQLQQVNCVLVQHAVHEDIVHGEANGAANGAEATHKGDVYFSSPPTTWEPEHPVWIVDYYGNWVALPSTDTEDHPFDRSTWIQEMEAHHWTIHWPTTAAIDSLTKPELIAALKTQFPAALEHLDATTKKPLKEEYLAVLAKQHTLTALSATLDPALGASS